VIRASAGLVPANAHVLIRSNLKAALNNSGDNGRSQSFASVACNDCAGDVIARVEQP
jgi:hypothetical protein